ncbi:MAG: carboxypeptidase regulatory-like domain-containing protein [Planctomycetota bacterium]|nr:carboxypeptidase regulatory-like domain-containing protein [Planctomycetota bacterium]
MTVFTKLLSSLLISFLFALVCGCGNDDYPRRYTVTGTVTFPDGEPVRTGVVEFLPKNGNLTANGNIQSDGTYSLSTIESEDGACPGEYIVVIKQFIFYDRIPEEKHSHGGDMSIEFADQKTTPLRFEVQATKNEANFVVNYRKKDQ